MKTTSKMHERKLYIINSFSLNVLVGLVQSCSFVHYVAEMESSIPLSTEVFNVGDALPLGGSKQFQWRNKYSSFRSFTVFPIIIN